MKVIDLLNKIANKENVPKKIKYNGDIYELKHYASHLYNYMDNEGDYLEDDWYLTNILNDEVEIIEDTPKEDKKIEKLKYCMVDGSIVIYGTRDTDEQLNYICESINEIIDRLNSENNE